MRIFVGADHRGVALKKTICDLLNTKGHEVIDVGTNSEEACDYPDISYKVATSVVKAKDSRGILVCNTGIGHSIAANKVPGAYAALCYNKEAAELSRQHNNSNILVIGSKFVSEAQILDIIDAWLNASFEGGRHQNRTDKIKHIEQEFLKGK